MDIEIVKKQESQNGAVLQVRASFLNEDRDELVQKALQKQAKEAQIDKADIEKAQDCAALVSLLETKIEYKQLLESVAHYVYEGISGLVCEKLKADIMFEPKFKKRSSNSVLDEGDVLLDIEYVLQPHFSLSSYEPVSVVIHENKLSDEMIHSYIDDLLKQHAHWEQVSRAVREGDYILVDMQTKRDGIIEDDLSGEHLSIEFTHGKMPSSFIENVVGLEIGQSKSFSFDALAIGEHPDKIQQKQEPLQTKEQAPKKDHFNVELTLKDICVKVIPELNDRFVCEALSDCGSSVKELREHVSKLLEERIDIENKQEREGAVDAELATRLTQAIPDIYIEHMAADLYATLRNNLTAQNLTITQYLEHEGMDKRQFQMSVLSQARDALRQGLALDALYEHLNCTLADKDIERALGELAPGRVKEARLRFKYNGTWSMVLQMAKRLKAHDWLMATAIFD